MIVEDFRTLNVEAAIEADLCLIGSGPAGWTIAEELRDSGLSVLVVESGGASPAADPGALMEIESVGAPLFNGRDNVLGGTSRSWGGRCVPLDDIDYEPRDWVGYSGWPFGPEAVAPFLDRAAEHLGAGFYQADGRRPETQGLHPRPAVDPALLRSVCWEDPKPVDFGRLFLARRNPNLRILLNATLTHIDTDETGAHLRSLEITGPDRRRATVRARAVVLCAGGIENARILLCSNRVVANGLGNTHGLVGRFLMDHPRDPGMIVRFDARDSARVRDLFGPYRLDTPRGRHSFVHGFALSAERQRREGLLNCAAWPFEALSFDDPVSAAKRLATGPRTRALRDAGLVLSQPGLLLRALHARVVADQRTRRRVERLDPLGLPVARVDWRISQREAESQAVLARSIADEFRRLGLPEVQLADWVCEGRPQDATFVDGCHPSGATRMAADPGQGVVDANCQVHGVRGLYVAGSSVFPTGGHANPTLMIVALAVRLARCLRERLAQASGGG
ncbi:MAG: GMC oxidoreductase [Janthinobacterium lividum]